MYIASHVWSPAYARMESKAGGSASFHLPTLISVGCLAGFCVSCVIRHRRAVEAEMVSSPSNIMSSQWY